jgi:hypothetical protein
LPVKSFRSRAFKKKQMWLLTGRIGTFLLIRRTNVKISALDLLDPAQEALGYQLIGRWLGIHGRGFP